MALKDDVPVLRIPNNATLEARSSVLTITDAKNGGHTKRIGADKTDIFTL